MLFDKKNFRLNSINYSNDPTEGNILLDYIYDKEKHSKKEKLNSDYGVFAGCFTFNCDSLNQFRLYGKEGDKEGVGLSLVFRDGFFSDLARLAMDRDPKWMSLKQDGEIRAEQKNITKEKSALFRCIYIDPDEQRVVTVGQKEEYLFYKEKNHGETMDCDEIAGYKKFINGLIEFLEEKMNKLRETVKDLNPEVIGRLLINLRYLVKHVAFKEEQECRIIKICRLDSEDVSVEDCERIYCEYKPNVGKYIKRIYFGPKATGMELFQDILTRNHINVSCEKSKNPLA